MFIKANVNKYVYKFNLKSFNKVNEIRQRKDKPVCRGIK